MPEEAEPAAELGAEEAGASDYEPEPAPEEPAQRPSAAEQTEDAAASAAGSPAASMDVEGAEAGAEAGPEPDAEAETDPEAETELEPETQPGPEPEPSAEAELEAEAEPEPEAELEAEPEPEPEEEMQSERKAEPELEPKAEPEPEPEPEPVQPAAPAPAPAPDPRPVDAIPANLADEDLISFLRPDEVSLVRARRTLKPKREAQRTAAEGKRAAGEALRRVHVEAAALRQKRAHSAGQSWVSPHATACFQPPPSRTTVLSDPMEHRKTGRWSTSRDESRRRRPEYAEPVTQTSHGTSKRKVRRFLRIVLSHDDVRLTHGCLIRAALCHRWAVLNRRPGSGHLRHVQGDLEGHTVRALARCAA